MGFSAEVPGKGWFLNGVERAGSTNVMCLVVAPFLVAPMLLAQTAQARPGQLRIEHQCVLDELNVKDAKGQPMELDDPRIPALLKKGWDLAGAWAAAYLDAHPTATKRDLERIFDSFAHPPQDRSSDYSFRGRSVRIAPSVYVVKASYGVCFLTGTFMVVARNQEGRFQAVWNIKDLAEKQYAQRDEIGRWLYLVRRAYYTGPLAVTKVLPLDPAANGHARFLVNAHQGADGGTQLAQLSIWEWDPPEAKPLMVETYEYAADFGGFRFDGRTVRITTKEPLATLFSCGMCPDPRGTWTVRITPGGVENLGHRFVQPEIQWADELLSMVEKGKATTQLADKKVLEALKARIGPGQAEFSWGMLGACQVLRRGQQGEFVLSLDEAQLHFHYRLRNGRPYFTEVEFK